MNVLEWLGGWIDNPFRFSHDMNRLLLFPGVVLRPAWFVSESIVDFIVLLLHVHESEANQGG